MISKFALSWSDLMVNEKFAKNSDPQRREGGDLLVSKITTFTFYRFKILDPRLVLGSSEGMTRTSLQLSKSPFKFNAIFAIIEHK